MEVMIIGDVPTYEQGQEQGRGGHKTRTGGLIRQALLQDDAPDGLNFKFHRNQFGSGDRVFKTPRHHHAFHQIRFAEKGTINYGPGHDIPEGDIAYFPRGTYYGPQLNDHGINIALQYGFDGEHQEGKAWDEVFAGALAKLKERGTFEEGVYIETDAETGEERRQDGVEALYAAKYELRTGRKFITAAEVYEEPILMHTKAFPYFPVATGVDVKHLGRFYDRPGPHGDTHILMVRLNEGGTYQLTADRAQLLWTMVPGLVLEGRTYPELTCAYCKRGEEGSIGGVDDVEVYIVEFPAP